MQGIGIQISISDVARDVKSYIYKSDPQLDVEYSFINGSNHFEINVKEDKHDPIIISFIPIDLSEYNENFLDLIDQGQILSYDLTKIT